MHPKQELLWGLWVIGMTMMIWASIPRYRYLGPSGGSAHLQGGHVETSRLLLERRAAIDAARLA